MASKHIEFAVVAMAGPELQPMTAQRQMALMQARMVARYQLVAVAGRSEELVKPQEPGTDGLSVGVSIGYGCRSIRVRKMHGRTWTDHMDFQIGEGWTVDLCSYLDTHFGFKQPVTPASVFANARKIAPIIEPTETEPDDSWDHQNGGYVR